MFNFRNWPCSRAHFSVVQYSNRVFKNDIFKVKRMKLFVSSHFSSISNNELKKFLTINISSSSTVENVFYCFSLANMGALVAFHVILYKLTNSFVNMSFFIAPTE